MANQLHVRRHRSELAYRVDAIQVRHAQIHDRDGKICFSAASIPERPSDAGRNGVSPAAVSTLNNPAHGLLVVVTRCALASCRGNRRNTRKKKNAATRRLTNSRRNAMQSGEQSIFSFSLCQVGIFTDER